MLPDHYGTLGLAFEATPEEIKKRYRTLARRYHPDVNPAPEAVPKIKEINEAYRILGDAEQRAVYDAALALARRQASPEPPRPSTEPRSSASAPRQAEYNGFGRVFSDPPPSSAPPKREAPKKRPPPPRPTAEPVLAEARLAFINRNFRRAEELCHQALAIDAKSAVAYEMLGDLYAKQGNTERAIACYSYTVQYNPQNRNAQAKLERILGGSSARPAPAARHAKAFASPDPFRDIQRREAILAGMTVALCVSFLATLGWLRATPGVPIVGQFSLNLFVSLGVCGGAAGALLGFFGGMRPIAQEFDLKGAQGGLCRLLLGLSALWFYASLLVYLGASAQQKRFSASLLRAYGVTVLLVALFPVAYVAPNPALATAQIAAFAGNPLFPAVLLGWWWADRVRLRSG